MGFLQRIEREKEAKQQPDYRGARGIATYAGGMVLVEGKPVLPAQSAVSCTQDPSIREIYGKYILVMDGDRPMLCDL
jgi:hypothetical protein